MQKGKVLGKTDAKKLGSLLTKQDEKPELKKTATSYLDTILREEIFGRKTEIKSKYLSKGNMVEEKSISLFQNLNPGLLFLKNKERRSNEWITGEPDNKQGKIRDFKSSWEMSTFPINETEIPTEMYMWQLDCYMELFDLRESELIYCLVDTPPNLINNELRRLSWKMGNLSIDSMDRDLVIDTVKRLVYTCLLYTSPSPRDQRGSRMPSSA